jgi:hypothetical protein
MAAFFAEDSHSGPFFGQEQWTNVFFSPNQSYEKFFMKNPSYGMFSKREEPEAQLAEPNSTDSKPKPTTHTPDLSKPEEPLQNSAPPAPQERKYQQPKEAALSITGGSTKMIHHAPSYSKSSAHEVKEREVKSTPPSYAPSEAGSISSSVYEIGSTTSDKKHDIVQASKQEEGKDQQSTKQDKGIATEKKSDELPPHFKPVGGSIRIGEAFAPTGPHGVLILDEKTGTLKGYRSISSFQTDYKKTYARAYKPPEHYVGMVVKTPDGKSIMFVPSDVAIKFNGHKA